MAQSIKIKENATRANARTAGAAAIVVAVVMIVQSILQAIISVFSNLAYSTADGNFFGVQNTFSPFVGSVFSFGTSVLPIAIGVFLAFWAVVPLTADLRVLQVVVRSLVASLIASAISLVITVVFSIVSAVASAGPVFGNSFPGADGSSVFYSLLGGLQSVFSTFVGVTPLVVLAGFLAWLWVSKGRPTASGA